jgi:phosphoribosylformylglycinamidine synthase
MAIKALVIRTAGTNCDEESAVALRLAGAAVTVEHINQLKKHADLSPYQILAVPGGFSYGDDIAAGKVFSLEIKLNFKDAIAKFIKNGGLVIGICNGFQVLAKTGLLPDADFKQRVTLMHNDCGKYQDRHVFLKLNKQGKGAKIWFSGMPDVIEMPMAHGEGKFFCGDAELSRVEKDNLVAFRYCDKNGVPATEFPANPNGSLNSIAGIFDTTGQVMGLMPHPERIMFKEQNLAWKDGAVTPWGLQIFKSAVAYCEGKK